MFQIKKKHVLFSQNIRKKIHETRNSVFLLKRLFCCLLILVIIILIDIFLIIISFCFINHATNKMTCYYEEKILHEYEKTILTNYFPLDFNNFLNKYLF
jgi:fatty acid desaturase